jgi:DNA excision repair protein ERCC-2
MASAFSQKHLLLLCNDTISTRYADRKESLADLCLLAQTLVSGKKGNYILFFPSYEYLKMVADILTFEEDVDMLIQTRDMTVQDRADTITMFRNGSHRTQVGLFVMGGVFSESIDLIGDMLSGVMIIGVGLPALSPLNNLLRSHFDHSYHNGFDYAYTYPGLNKVIQAVGRLIRTETDRGVAILVDDRFGSRKYQSLFPKEWSHIRYCETPEEIQARIQAFWNETEEREGNN